MKNLAIENRVLQRDRVLQRRVLERYYCTSLIRGFWDEIFLPSKPRTTEEPRTGEGHRKVDI